MRDDCCCLMSSIVGPSYDGSSLQQRCDCEHCVLHPETTTHNDASHDQSLSQRIVTLNGALVINGGTTKCARVLVDFLSGAEVVRDYVIGRRIIELGSGSGVVGLSLSRNGAAHVTLTDQAPLLALIQDNARTNHMEYETEQARVHIAPLLWGSADDIAAFDGAFDVVVGCDLIYDIEAHDALIRTYEALITKSVGCRGLLAHIQRFKRESEFFDGLRRRGIKFALIHRRGDIDIYQINSALAPPSKTTDALTLNT